MAQQTLRHNPFMLMMNPEVVLAAVERSERLSRLNRHLCRPLDRLGAASKTTGDATDGANLDDDFGDAGDDRGSD